jgi:predicted dehydrogenase
MIELGDRHMSHHDIPLFSDSTSLPRRQFLQGALTALAAPLCLPAIGTGASVGTTLNHACIGVGGMMGFNDLQNFLSHPRVRITALCDVDTQHLQKAREAVPSARVYRDWRELLDNEGDRIDSVNVTVPDHMHFPIAHKAIQSGKHVYCQKPLCHDVAEVRALIEATRKAGVITQLGTHITSTLAERTALTYLRQGVIGKVKRVILCANRPGAIEAYRLLGPRPASGQPVPAHLDWDLWIGTAPMRPYAADIYHPVRWRAWQDFGTGWSGDIGCHLFDLVWKGLELAAPLRVKAQVQTSWQESPARRADTWPQSNHITWIFPGNDHTQGDELMVEWYDGLFYPPKEIMALYPGRVYPTESAMLIGSEGALLYPLDSAPWLLPRDKFIDQARPTLTTRNHYHHFVDACLGGEKTECHFLQCGPMTEAILLGTVAVRHPDQWLDWDAAHMTIPNLPQAEQLLRRSYRQGWEVS